MTPGGIDPKLTALILAVIDYGWALGRASYDHLRPEDVAETETELDRARERMREARKALTEESDARP